MSRASTQRALATGLIMAVTLNAFEAVAVVTAMPAISEELDGDRLYGAAFSAYMLASLVALVVSGEQADRRGPGGPVPRARWGSSPPAWWWPAWRRRCPSSWPAGCCRARARARWPAWPTWASDGRGRPRSSPVCSRSCPRRGSCRASSRPLAAGWITEELGWRWVFLGLLPLVPVLLLLAARPLTALGPPSPSERRVSPTGATGVGDGTPAARWPFAVRLAIGSALVLAGLQSGSLLVAAAFLVPGFALGRARAGPPAAGGDAAGAARHPRRGGGPAVREHRLLRLRHVRAAGRHPAPRCLDAGRRGP